jgi:hypothetical protein
MMPVEQVFLALILKFEDVRVHAEQAKILEFYMYTHFATNKLLINLLNLLTWLESCLSMQILIFQRSSRKLK